MSNLAQRITELAADPPTNNAIGNHRSDISRLVRLSARIGRDPLLVQGSSGNTSLKLNGTLWIKASGKWLAKADKEDLFVPVDLSECVECFRAGRPLTRDPNSHAASLLPSVETFMHAVLPQQCAVHVHSVDTLAWAVRSDATAQLAERLSGLRWKWIPYVPSGLSLARKVHSVCSTHGSPEVLILGNHGLVVCGESCAAAEFMLGEVQRRLATKPRHAAEPKFGRLEAIRDRVSWRLPECERLHSLGTDMISRRVVNRGILYPCQAMFLGRSVTLLQGSKNLSDLRARIHQLEASCSFVIIEGSGVLINNRITAAAQAVLHGFAEVVRRIDALAPLRYLTKAEVNALMDSYGDCYRRSAEDGGR